VLLIDDMWTSGASAESAAAALRAAGARSVAGMVIGRHVNRGFHHNDARLRRIAEEAFDFEHCVLCCDEPVHDEACDSDVVSRRGTGVASKPGAEH
jgi:hypothetical protein